MLPETVARLAKIDNIIGIKEACGSLEQISDVIRMCPADFILLSGDDFTSMPTVLVGGKGVISVVSNIHPAGMSKMIEAALAGDLAHANELHYKLFPLMKCMFACPSPAPAKQGLQLMKVIRSASPRLPITPVDEPTMARLKAAMAQLEML
jgi:4-hydroxy-tetrahydrodipicolinate synthase